MSFDQVAIIIGGACFLFLGVGMRKGKKPSSTAFILGGLVMIVLTVAAKLLGLEF
jgi:hypothetical protein